MASDKPRIVIFTDWYLPGYKAGGPIQSCVNLVAHLHDRFDFYVVSSDRDYLEEQPYPHVKIGETEQVGAARVRYLSPRERSFRSIRKTVKQLAPDRVYINGMFSPTFSIYPLMAARSLGLPTTVAPRGMLAPGALAIKPMKKKVFLNALSLLGAYKSVEFHATNAVESAQIRRHIGLNAQIAEVPNIPGLTQIERANATTHKNKNHLNVLTTARLAREKNIAFALECLAELPDHIRVNQTFIGSAYDEKYAGQCGELAQKLPDHVRVEFSGPKPPREVAEKLGESHLFFLPTLGENYGHAIIEALLAGVPALISDRTPWRNLVRDGLGLDADLAEKRIFVDYLVKLAEMEGEEYKEQFKNVGANARRLIDTDALRRGYIDLLSR